MIPRLVAIAGCSGCGKTALAQSVQKRLVQCSVISLDSYYHPQSDRSLEERASHNYDHPDALEWSLIESHLLALLRGETIEVPEYLFDLHTRSVARRRVEPQHVVLVEGIHALHRAEIRALSALRVFVHTDPAECLRRRMDRDVADRGRTPAFVLEQYHRTVAPMAREYVLPSRAHARLVISGEQKLADSVDAVLHALSIS
ncbi:MAG: uridine kinase [Acidobacteriota bacterium]